MAAAKLTALIKNRVHDSANRRLTITEPKLERLRLPDPFRDLPATTWRSLRAAVSRRRALSRDQPVTPTTWPRIRPLSFFEALTYTFVYRVVTSARDIIDNSFLMPDNAHRYAGIPK